MAGCGLSCNACNVSFEDDSAQRQHYRSEWHRHNLKRKVAGVPGVSEALFIMRLESLAAEKKSEKMTYTCLPCNKSYATAKAHGQHLQSKAHLGRASTVEDSTAVVRPAAVRSAAEEKKPKQKPDDDDEDDDDWEEIDGEDMELQSFTDDECDTSTAQWDPSKCFVCDAESDGTVEGCVEHLHKEHGFFIPDAEYLTDARGMLSYLGLKVTEGFVCLYCDERGKRFSSLDAVRKHMVAKSHCKLRYGEDGGGAEEELEEFYDFMQNCDEHGGELVCVDQEPAVLTSGGFELVLKGTGEDGLVTTKTVGSRELHRYYRQKPRPTNGQDGHRSNVNAVVARYRSMGLATREPYAFVSAKQTKNLRYVKLEAMRTKLGLKNNVIRNLPKNCTY